VTVETAEIPYLLAHPTRFERVTFAFGGQRSSHAACREIFFRPITVRKWNAFPEGATQKSFA
jgi:hypothetical protein